MFNHKNKNNVDFIGLFIICNNRNILDKVVNKKVNTIINYKN